MNILTLSILHTLSKEKRPVNINSHQCLNTPFLSLSRPSKRTPSDLTTSSVLLTLYIHSPLHPFLRLFTLRNSLPLSLSPYDFPPFAIFLRQLLPNTHSFNTVASPSFHLNLVTLLPPILYPLPPFRLKGSHDRSEKS